LPGADAALHVRVDTIKQALRSCEVLKGDVGLAGMSWRKAPQQTNLRLDRIVVAAIANTS
jgi:hypothetical protein